LFAVALGLVTAFAAWLAATALQQDLAAYFTAGRARRLGLDPYVNHAPSGPWDGVALFAHSRFLYPPLVADLLRPLAALSYPEAKVLFTAVAVACWVAASVGAARSFEGRAPAAAASALAAGALFFPLYTHLERGQIDLVASLLLLAVWRLRQRPAAAGTALAAAATLKPALAGLLPLLAAAGRWRAAAAAAGVAAALALAGVALSGPALLREYATSVLPRAALYGEGGTEAMLLPAERLAAVEPAVASGRAVVDGHSYRQTTWELPLAASLPRLLAPEAPARWASTLPFAAALLALVAVARRIRGRAPEAEAALLFGGAVACVVTSPAGWIMGLVLGLPLVPLGRAAWRRGGRRRRAAGALGGALAACAVPPPFTGWGALAGTALAAAAAWLAVEEAAA
jgi:hypothetical protein